MTSDCPLREKILACDGHILVTGGPGSGKTTIALRKAVARIKAGLKPGQAILFLSFSRAAIARIADAAKKGGAEHQLPKSDRYLLSMQTFHSFFWELLRSHAYLLGAPRKLSVLLPQDEKALSEGIDEDDAEWNAWLVERQRLYRTEGRIAFDLFPPNALELLTRSSHLLRMVAQKHPLIIVDEAQDTGEHAWRCIQLLSAQTQVICLCDLEQQIFDHLPGVDPGRIDAIRQALNPLEIDFATQNHRSAATEILTFGNDILANRTRGAGYRGISTLTYSPKNVGWNSLLRKAISLTFKSIYKESGERAQSLAILTTNNKSALQLSTGLNGLAADGGKPVRHKLMFDEAQALLSARFAAFLLEPKRADQLLEDIAQSLDMIATSLRATGKGKANQLQLAKWRTHIQAGKIPNNGMIRGLQSVFSALQGSPFTGDPRKDWTKIKRLLSESGQADLQQIARHLDYLVAFQRGTRIGANLSNEWIRDGQYTNARQALDSAIVKDQILDGADEPNGIVVMTIHKAKGKQFDGVIIVRQGRHSNNGVVSSFLWWDDSEPYPRSRKILRVGVTRARVHTLILTPAWPPCPLLAPYRLDSIYQIAA